MPTALVRAPSDTLVDALTGHFAPGERPDPAEAREEHAAVVDGLRWLGFTVQALATEGHADGCFVEDHAVIIGERALLCRTGAPTRRAEAATVHQWLQERLEVVSMTQGTLDGGDVLVHDDTILVGQGERSSPGALRALEHAFPTHEVIPVFVPAGSLHLKCLCSAPAGVVISAIDLPIPHRRVPLVQSYGANAVGLGDRALIAAGYPAVEQALADRELRRVRLRSLRIADGSLTCLSLRMG